MRTYYEGLPAAANVEQSIIQAQLLILKDLQRAARAGIALTFVTEPGAGTEIVAG